MPGSLRHIEPGYCTCESVYDVIKGHLVKGVPFKKRGFPKWFASRKNIPFTPEVVNWELASGRTKWSRGLNLEGFKTALNVFYQSGWITAGKYTYPDFFKLPPSSRYVVGRNGSEPKATKQEQNEMFPVEDATTARERWSEEAKQVIATEVKARNFSLEEIVEILVAKGLRKDVLIAKTLQRQVDRMAGRYYSAEELVEYKKVHLPTSRNLGVPAPDKSSSTSGVKRSPWTEEQNRALVDDATSMTGLSHTCGVKNFKKLARVFKKRKIREGVTDQTVRHHLRKLAIEPGPKYGLTVERYNQLNDPGHYFKKTPASRPRPRPKPEPKVRVVLNHGEDITVETRGLPVTLTPELQRKAIDEFLTPEMKMQAFEAYVNRRLG